MQIRWYKFYQTINVAVLHEIPTNIGHQKGLLNIIVCEITLNPRTSEWVHNDGG